MSLTATLKAFVIVIVMLFAGCAGNETKQYQFYYYPDLNLYFDVAKNNFIYSLDGGAVWDTIDAKSNNLPASLGNKIEINSFSDSIWKDNASHREKYGGYIYNVVDDDDSTDTTSATIITEKEISKKIPSTTNKEEVKIKERKGLGKLLTRIFGKKKEKQAKEEE